MVQFRIDYKAVRFIIDQIKTVYKILPNLSIRVSEVKKFDQVKMKFKKYVKQQL